jgi:hypothetical protein
MLTLADKSEFNSRLMVHTMSNVGGIDRVLRVLVGVVAIGFATYLYLNPTLALMPSVMMQWLPQATWMLIIAIVGAVMLLTGLMGFCLFYLPFGLSSAARPKKQ